MPSQAQLPGVPLAPGQGVNWPGGHKSMQLAIDKYLFTLRTPSDLSLSFV